MRFNYIKLLEPRLTACSLALLFLSFLTEGCSTTKPEATPASDTPVAETPAPAPERIETNQVIRLKALGVAFLEPKEKTPPPVKSIEATGFGLPALDTENDAQKRMTALEAARYRALANLAEKSEGLEVSRDARTIDMAFAREEVHVRIHGQLKGVSEVAQDYDTKTEIATVTLKMPLGPEPDSTHQKPLSLEQRKARAIAAARIQATASLREQIGQVYVEQDVLVEDLILTHQHARVYVQGLLEGISFSEALWLGESRCEVVATLVVDQDEMEKITQSMGDQEVQ